MKVVSMMISGLELEIPNCPGRVEEAKFWYALQLPITEALICSYRHHVTRKFCRSITFILLAEMFVFPSLRFFFNALF